MRSVVVVPTYNEAGSITVLLDRLREHAPTSDVLVVDDGSPDGTAALVRADPRFGSAVHLVERRTKDGLGGAYRRGFGWALARRYDAVVQMDADLSHPAERVPELLAALRDADVAIGSRYTSGGGVAAWPLRRRLLSRGGNLYARLLLGLSTHDVTAGFKAFRATALERIAAIESTSDGYCFQIENTWRAERRGLSVVEVPIVFTDRTEGESKMTSAIMREALLNVLRWRIAEVGGGRHPLRSWMRAA